MVLGSNFLASTAKIIKPPIIKAHATTIGLNSTCLIKSTAKIPITTAGMNASKTLIAKRRAYTSPEKKPLTRSIIFNR